MMAMKVCLVAAGFFVLLDAVSAQTKGKVILSPVVDDYFIVGTKVTMVCTLDNGDDVPTTGDVGWKKESSPLSSGGNIEITGPNKRELKITVVLADRKKVYSCTPHTKLESDIVYVYVREAQQPGLECFPPPALPVGRMVKCTCSGDKSTTKPQEYQFKLDGTSKTAEGTNTPKNELSITGTMALDGKNVTCAAKYQDNAGGTSPETYIKLAFFEFPTCTCTAPTTTTTAPPTTIGFVLLLSTLLMKE